MPFYNNNSFLATGHFNCTHVSITALKCNRFEISLRGKISLRCEVTSLSAFT